MSTLLYTMGPQAESVMDQLQFDADADKAKWTPVVEKLDAYFQPTINVIHQRCLFEKLVQEPGQTVEEFVSLLHATAKYCQFDKAEERIRDRLVAHMLSREVSKTLQLMDHSKLTLAEAVLKARQNEQLTRELQQQRSASSPQTPSAVHAASSHQTASHSGSRPDKRARGTRPGQQRQRSQAASRSFTPAETRYAQIEKELLASVWCCEHFTQYLYGGPQFTLHTDHKPLIPLINTRDLGNVPLRCQRLLIRLLRYNVHAVYVPGKDMTVADALSRAPISEAEPILKDTQQDTEACVAAVTAALCSPGKAKEIALATADDRILSKVLAYTQSGWPRSVTPELVPYFNARSSLSHSNGLLWYAQRLVIPSVLRKDTLAKLHTGHQGVHRCKARALETVWWPCITQDVNVMVMQCQTCIKKRHQPPEPLQATVPPERPWQRIGVDLCQVGHTQYLVVVDYLSRYLEVEAMSSTTTQHVVKTLRHLFATHGNPEELVSDNGPQFASEEFAKFAEQCDFEQAPHTMPKVTELQNEQFKPPKD